MSESKKVPRLRFKEFSGEWEEKKLGEVSEYVEGNSSTNLEVPILTISAKNGWMKQTERFGNVIAGNELKKYTLLKKGELSYNHGNSKVAKYGAVFELCDYEKALVPRVYHSFRMNKDYSAKFVNYIFLSKIPDRQLRKLITSGARMDGLLNINKKSFASISIVFPHIQEQTKIGEYFSKLDKLIRLQEQKVEQLKQLKRGYLQKMFPQKGAVVPRLRFKEFNEEWKENKLGEISKVVGGGTPNTSINEYWNGNIDWYSPAEIGNQVFINSSNRKISKLGLQKSSAKLLPAGTVLFTSRAGIGKTAILQKAATTNQGFQSIIPKDNKLNTYFLFCMTSKLKTYGEKMGSGSTFAEVSGKQMKKMPLSLPGYKEQTKIGEYFSKLDQLIKLQELKVENLNQLKHGYLQKMFC